MAKLPGEIKHSQLLTLDRQPTTDQSMDTTKVELGKRESFIGLLNRSRNDSKTALSPRSTPAWLTAHKAENLEHIAQPAGRSTGWRRSFPGASVDLTPSRQLVWSVSAMQRPHPHPAVLRGISAAIVYSGKEGIVNLVSFRESSFWSSSAGWNALISEETATQVPCLPPALTFFLPPLPQ